ncbi:MAG: type III pantothenate kinase [Pseudomonadales bacterium]|jgi:type III pantothenate kinase|nr:type III pantothenate kinase [Pseudomonadales bacterium]MDP7597103.1 type III pantothenate kinase [Pseudomonadales bacterium]HJN51338.1 type III pantothenate kinase [Pseudomonadales bacterium]|tara:strand:- start:1471 stop:2208 length:738 start_codon:yes stop_codon:yes gene_type:complete
MILDLDAGNTRLKWRTLADDGCTWASGANTLADADFFAGISSADDIARVRVSCVAGTHNEDLITAWCKRELNVAPEFARSQARLGRVSNGYADPQRLGVDRWMAILAAYATVLGSCCIVDCGSATTLDFVMESGDHLGGLITPGLTMMRTSLLQDTQEIRLFSNDGNWDADRIAGRSTEEAVLGGILGMTVALICNSVDRFERHEGTEAALILTGGDAHIVASHLSRGCEVNSSLVLDGLALALP